MKVSDPNSSATNATIYDYWDLTIIYECDTDVLSVGSEKTLYVYQTGSGDESIIENVSQTVAGCKILYTAHIYQEGFTSNTGLNKIDANTTAKWVSLPPAAGYADLQFVKSFTAATGTLVLNHAKDGSYDPYKDY